MSKKLLSIALLLTLTFAASPTEAEAGGRIMNRWGQRYAATMSWHNNYVYTPYGQPLALVVPPTVQTHRQMGWGVSQSEMTPIYHQYQRGYPGAIGNATTRFRNTPAWPSHTSQFGVYYLRAPW